MTLRREEIDILLESLEAEAWRRFRADPDGPQVLRDIIDKTRVLLRGAATEHHQYIYDQSQHLVFSLGEATRDTQAGSSLAGGRASAPAVAVPANPDRLPEIVSDQYDETQYDVNVCELVNAADADAPAADVVEAEQLPQGERRQKSASGSDALREGLSSEQLTTLRSMEYFGWTLDFVRRPMFQPPIPVAFDRNRQRYAVIEFDGDFREDPDFRVRED